MRLYDGTKTQMRVQTAYSEKFKGKINARQGSGLSPVLFAIVVDVTT